VPLHDRAEAQPFDRADDRRVKDLAREAETDQADVERRSNLRLRYDAQIGLRGVANPLVEAQIGSDVAQL
jgi:hypothetical protein